MTQLNIHDPSLLHAPIDQFGRYYIVASTIRELAKKANQNNVTVLDIGGYKGLTSKFFPKGSATVTIVDLYDCDDKNYVKGSALKLPFEDNSFDYVVTFEVLEHISRDQRETFIREALRVSKGPLLLTAPFAGSKGTVAKAEMLVNDLWRDMYKANHPWLEEHIDNRIPTEEEIEAIVKKHGLEFEKIGNNDVRLWNLLVSFNFTTTLFRPSGVNDNIHSFYNEHLDELEYGASTYYRQIYIIGKNVKGTLASRYQNDDTMAAKRLDAELELVNLILKTLVQDVQGEDKENDREVKKLSQELEGRIKDHDALAHEVDRLSTELVRLRESLPVRMHARLAALKRTVRK